MSNNELRVIIAGCRDYNNYENIKHAVGLQLEALFNIGFEKQDVVIISGGASGVDKLGEKYAKDYEYELKVFPAKWDKYGVAAGPIRNTEMAKYASEHNNGVLIAFWDGKSRGTKNMINVAKKHNLLVYIFDIDKKE